MCAKTDNSQVIRLLLCRREVHAKNSRYLLMDGLRFLHWLYYIIAEDCNLGAELPDVVYKQRVWKFASKCWERKESYSPPRCAF